ncbi:MAG: hypothetical protein Q7U51_12985 [Methanoregula sp.]|nr:hypothetical protein [Methanoregula sp.]
MYRFKAITMKSILFLLPALVLVLCALSVGCTSPTQAEIKPVDISTPLPTPVISSVATVVSTPVAVDTLPPEQFVDLQLTKERPDFSIHLLYNGGKGELFVQNVMMRVTLSDGKVIEQYLNDKQRKPRRGDELIIQGSRGNDRVEVFVTSAGKTYKAIDKPMITSSA